MIGSGIAVFAFWTQVGFATAQERGRRDKIGIIKVAK
jgi:hypothetical protein